MRARAHARHHYLCLPARQRQPLVKLWTKFEISKLFGGRARRKRLYIVETVELQLRMQFGGEYCRGLAILGPWSVALQNFAFWQFWQIGRDWPVSLGTLRLGLVSVEFASDRLMKPFQFNKLWVFLVFGVSQLQGRVKSGKICHVICQQV